MTREYAKENKYMKRYYLCLRTGTHHIWHCTEATMATTIMRSYDFIIPLDRKPRKGEIKEA